MRAVVYVRDATWSAQSSRATRWHWLRGDGLSACGSVVLLDTSDRPASEVPHDLRCRASGCRQRWGDHDRIVQAQADLLEDGWR